MEEEAFEKSDIVTLRIRSETGKRTIIVKLLKNDQMQAVYDAVMPYIDFAEKAF